MIGKQDFKVLYLRMMQLSTYKTQTIYKLSINKPLLWFLVENQCRISSAMVYTTYRE